MTEKIDLDAIERLFERAAKQRVLDWSAINDLIQNGRVLIKLVKELKKALETIPYKEYGEAQSEGCDPNGAWDCFVAACSVHVHESLARLNGEGGE